MRQGAVFQVRVDLLDDGMPAAGFVGGDGVQGACGKERVEPVSVEDGPLSCAGVWIQVWDSSDDQAPGDGFALFPGTERGVSGFGDFGGGDPPVRGSHRPRGTTAGLRHHRRPFRLWNDGHCRLPLS